MFKDKVCVITGGAHGIGKTIKEEFIKENAKCYVIDKSEGEHFVGDISDEKTLIDFVNYVIQNGYKCNSAEQKDIKFTISFGGSFFALVNTDQLGIGEINAETVPTYIDLGMKMMEKINKEIEIQHPELDITSVDLVEFYGPTPNPDKATLRNVVVFGEGQADRSPCGTGTSAKLATLYHWGEIKVGEEFKYESFIGSIFKGVIKETAKVGEFDAVVPMITGSCYLTGFGTYLIDQDDPLKYGFIVG